MKVNHFTEFLFKKKNTKKPTNIIFELPKDYSWLFYSNILSSCLYNILYINLNLCYT